MQLRGRAFKDIQVAEVIHAQKKEGSVPVLWAQAQAISAVQLMTTLGVHRAGVFAEDGSLQAIMR
jgi:hypothetical protein